MFSSYFVYHAHPPFVDGNCFPYILASRPIEELQGDCPISFAFQMELRCEMVYASI